MIYTNIFISNNIDLCHKSNKTMKTKIQEWLQRIDQITAAFNNYFGQMTNEQLNSKPNAATWSIAQNIDHLMVINNSYLPAIEEIRAGKQKLGRLSKLDFMTRFFGNFILKSVGPSRKRKMKTFPVWEPSKSDVEGDILAKFTEHQENLKKLIASSEDLLTKGTLIASPANKNIVYKLEVAFEIIVMHEQRHLAQAKEIQI